jgi:hypothetical protein
MSLPFCCRTPTRSETKPRQSRSVKAKAFLFVFFLVSGATSTLPIDYPLLHVGDLGHYIYVVAGLVKKPSKVFDPGGGSHCSLCVVMNPRICVTVWGAAE